VDIWLNDNDQYSELGTCSYENCLALFSNGRIGRIHLDGKFATATRIERTYQLLKNGDALIKVETSYYGMKHAAFKELFAEQTPEARRRYFLKEMNYFSPVALPEGEATTDFSSYPGKVSFTTRVPGFVIKDGDYLEVFLKNPFVNSVFAGEDKRQHLYCSNSRINEMVTLNVDYSQFEEYDVVNVPYAVDYGFPSKKAFVCNSKLNSGWARFTFEKSLYPYILPAGEYGKLIAFNRKVNKRAFNTLVFKKAR
ncbi:MAG: hypothetical protein IKS20_01735, partial [Victivallales bacterium]|nr:hypothetical protein [Victivallales bacterium]